jgi:nitrite reductase/ring-hydroxylating ferredoxin subunit
VCLLPWIKVCDLKSLSSGEIMEFNYERKKILLVKIGIIFMPSDRICHADADLSLGILNEQENSYMSLHMSAFKLETGKPENLPAEIP